MVSIDFFTAPTIRFQILYVFLVLAHDRRRIMHFNVTAHPTAEWTGQQLREASHLIRLLNTCFETVTASLVMSLASMWNRWASRQRFRLREHPQGAYVERVIGSLRREYLDHVIVFHEASLYHHVKLFPGVRS